MSKAQLVLSSHYATLSGLLLSSIVFSWIRDSTVNFVEFNPKSLEDLRKPWTFSILGCFLHRHWTFSKLLFESYGAPPVLDLACECFLFRFFTGADGVRILINGPWTIRGEILQLIP